jgi:hypothetical protein
MMIVTEPVAPGTTALLLSVLIFTPDGRLQPVAYDELMVWYLRDGAAAGVEVEPVDGTPGDWTSGGWAGVQSGAIDKLIHQFGVPDAALATGATGVTIMFSAWDEGRTDTVIRIPLAASASPPTPADVWAHTPRTLTQPAAQVAAVVAGTSVTVRRGESTTIALTGLGSITGFSQLWFTAKRGHGEDPDARSLVQITQTGGLLYIARAAATNSALGSITVNSAAAGDITITIDEEATKLLPIESGRYDVQVRIAGDTRTLTEGAFTVARDITRATN